MNNNLHNATTPPGVYFAARISEKSKKELLKFCSDVIFLNMDDSSSIYENRVHATILSSKETSDISYDFISKEFSQKKFIAHASHWSITSSPNTGKKCLILHLCSNDMDSFHYYLCEKTGLTHSFDHYSPHISIHYNYEYDLPQTIPNFPISFDLIYNKPYFFKDNGHSDNTANIVNTATTLKS